MTGRRGRRRKKVLVDPTGKMRRWKLKEETPDVSVPRTHFGRCYGSVMKQPAGRRW